ncbi:ufm1-specific protease 1 [Neosynchiropus ocellatus]
MNVHSGLPTPLSDPVRLSIVSGDYQYFHYGCDGFNDRGWGCGYRTIQTISSWLRFNRVDTLRPPPSISEIQRALVSMEDKPDCFCGSREWVGTVEASLVLEHFYNVPSRLIHVRGGGSDLETVAVEDLHRHFQKHGSPVMMGGDRDNSSKGVLGVCSGKEGSFLLVLDPHYWGPQLGVQELQLEGWVKWRDVSTLDRTSFYNLCLPQSGPNKTL